VRAQANHGEKAGWGNETHHVEMMETLKHLHLAPHALPILFDFLLRNRLQCDLAHEVPRGSLAGGILRGRRGQRGSGERVGGGGGASGAWMDRLRGAQQRPTVLVVRVMHVMSRSAICDGHDAAFVLLFPNEPATRMSRMSYCFFLFADGGPSVVAPSPLGRQARTSLCRCADSIQIGNYGLSRLLGGFFG